MKVKSNYHSHVSLCNHAEGTPREHIQKMVELGYDIIGISDHMPIPRYDDFPPEWALMYRMKESDLEGYIEEINACKEEFKGQAKILVGLESEYLDTHLEWLKTLSQKTDFLIFGNHDIVIDGCLVSAFRLRTTREVEEYGRSSVRALSTGLYSIMAHPDLYLMKYPWNETSERIARMIAEASITYNVPLELNANGIRRGLVKTDQGMRYLYPRMEFWEVIREYNCEVIINSDAHYLNQHDDEELRKAYKLGNEWGLNIIDSLE